MATKIKIPKTFKHLFQPKRYKIYFGGRAGAKSHNIALALLLKGAQQQLRILCCREIQLSLKDSVLKLLDDLNTEYDLGYVVTENSLKHPNGTEFLFSGLKTNITKVKSKEGIDIAWVEEAENVSSESWSVLIPTIRKSGSEIWISFNPNNDTDPTWTTFIKKHYNVLLQNKEYEDDQYYIRWVNYDENPFISKTLLKEIIELKEYDYDSYRHIYLGYPTGAGENILIKPKWFDAAVDAYKKLGLERSGARVIGYDPADGGVDDAALIARQGASVIDLELYKEKTLEQSCFKAQQYCVDNSISDMVYDVVGVGVGARVYFDKIDPREQVNKTQFDSRLRPPKDLYKKSRPCDEMFTNHRSMYFWKLRDRFISTYNAVVNKQYVDPEDMIDLSGDLEYLELLKNELCTIEVVDRNGRIGIESKQNMTRSPNAADALMMSFMEIDHTNETIDVEFLSEIW